MNFSSVEEPKKPVYAGEAMHSMANQQLVTLDKWNRLVANKAFTPGAEGKLDKTEIFLIEKGEDGLVSIKSAQNDRYVWMESDLLMAECNISVKGCVPAKFNRVCYDNSTQATANNTGEYLAFKLHTKFYKFFCKYLSSLVKTAIICIFKASCF